MVIQFKQKFYEIDKKHKPDSLARVIDVILQAQP
jgi:hypothetical protein